MITELAIPTDQRKHYFGEHPLPDRLAKLSRLNVFVGPNNSGKSRLLRGLFADNALGGMTDRPSELTIREKFQELDSLLITHADASLSKELKDHIQQAKYPLLTVAFGEHQRRDFDTATKNLSAYVRGTVAQVGSFPIAAFDKTLERYRQAVAAWQAENLNPWQNIEPIPRVYVPSLRGLRAPEGDQARFHTKRTIKDYFDADGKGSRLQHLPDRDEFLGSRAKKGTVFTGDTLFEEIQACLLGDHAARQLVEDFEHYLSKAYFGGTDVNLIPKRRADTLLIRIGSEEYLAPNVGDGLQQLIVMSFPLFVFKGQPLLLFLEEPELFLHAGMQLRFAEHVPETAAENPEHQVLIATHSSCFLDLTLDHSNCTVYRVAKTAAGDMAKKKDPEFSFSFGQP